MYFERKKVISITFTCFHCQLLEPPELCSNYEMEKPVEESPSWGLILQAPINTKA